MSARSIFVSVSTVIGVLLLVGLGSYIFVGVVTTFDNENKRNRFSPEENFLYQEIGLDVAGIKNFRGWCPLLLEEGAHNKEFKEWLRSTGKISEKRTNHLCNILDIYLKSGGMEALFVELLLLWAYPDFPWATFQEKSPKGGRLWKAFKVSGRNRSGSLLSGTVNKTMGVLPATSDSEMIEKNVDK